MDYSELAIELFNIMQSLKKEKSHNNINETLHGEAFVLDYIANHNGDVLPGEIGHEMHVSTARIAVALNGLEKKELITRRIDKHDRRKILVGITIAGKELANKNRQSCLSAVIKTLELLGEDDAKEYVRINKKLAKILPDFSEII